MDVKKISEKENIAKIFVNGTDSAFINSIRRVAMNSVPTIAIENVSIHENNSVMFDEMLAHRLALLPVKTDTKAYKTGEKVTMMLEKEGPDTVYSKDIQSTEPSIEVIDKKVPIVKLGKNQRVRMELEAVMGTGKQHAKWQPALISFNEVPGITIDIKDPKEQKKFLSEMPAGMFEAKAGKIILSDPLNANIDMVMQAAEEFGDKAVLEMSQKSFVMTIENFGQLETSEILLDAANVLKEKAKNMKEELKKI